MFIEVLSLTYHSPITIDSLTYGVLVCMRQRHCWKQSRCDAETVECAATDQPHLSWLADWAPRVTSQDASSSAPLRRAASSGVSLSKPIQLMLAPRPRRY